MLPRHLALMLLVQLLWGVNFAVAKFGLDHFAPIFFVALRFSLVAVLLVFVVGLPKRAMMKQLLPLSATMGVMHFTLIFLGMRDLDAATSSIAVQLQTPFAAIMAAFFFGEKLGWRRVLGMIVAFAGVTLIAGEPRFSDNPWPLMAVIAAALVWAAGNIQVKALGDSIDAVTLNGWIAILAAPQLLIASWLIEGPQWVHIPEVTWVGWGALLFQAVVIAIFTYWIWYNMMRRYPVNQVMPFTLLLPMIGVAAGALMRGEEITWQMLVGGLATIAGVGIIVLRRPTVAAPATKTGI
ncbi:DMT family transporter [Dongia deserti]|uniref:DMT family transporter n=1 Tax=Dongia deserti TaxID=2268030 RepID=UPI000E656D9B|nr:EamA family transporter [Dongia deserti]